MYNNNIEYKTFGMKDFKEFFYGHIENYVTTFQLVRINSEMSLFKKVMYCFVAIYNIIEIFMNPIGQIGNIIIDFNKWIEQNNRVLFGAELRSRELDFNDIPPSVRRRLEESEKEKSFPEQMQELESSLKEEGYSDSEIKTYLLQEEVSEIQYKVFSLKKGEMALERMYSRRVNKFMFALLIHGTILLYAVLDSILN